MAVKQRGSSWQAIFWHEGERYRKQFKTEAEASTWEADTLATLEGRYQPVETVTEAKVIDPTLTELLDMVHRDRWINTKAERSAMLNAKHVIRVLGENRKASSLCKLDSLTLKTEFRKRGISDSTVNRKLAAFSVLVQMSAEWGFIPAAFKVGMIRERSGRVRVVELHEETAMLEWCRRYGFDELADIIAVAIDSGLRRSELLKLTAQDIQDNLWAHDTKNGDSRDVPLSPRAKEILHRRKQGLPRGGKVFTLSGWQLMDQWRRAATAIGIDLEEDREFVFHICRHTFVSRALAANVDIRTVMELSGHKTMAVVQRYAHSSPARKTAAVALISGWSAAQTQQPPHAPTHV